MEILQVVYNAFPKYNSEIKENQEFGKIFKSYEQQNSFRIPFRMSKCTLYLKTTTTNLTNEPIGINFVFRQVQAHGF